MAGRIGFQALEWRESSSAAAAADADQGDRGGDGEDAPAQEHDGDAPGLVVTVYGRTAAGAVVRCALEGFRPSMLLRMSKAKATRALELAGVAGGVEVAATRLKDLLGFSAADHAFSVLRFRSAPALAAARRKLKDLGLELFNCRVQPFMQLLHRAGVSPGGWVTVPCPPRLADAPFVDLACAWTELRPWADPPAPMAPWTVTAFDIECYSASGDFPAAKKGYNRFARDVIGLVDAVADEADGADQVARAVAEAFAGRPAGPVAALDLQDGHRPPSAAVLRQALLSDLAESMAKKQWRAASTAVRSADLAAKMDCLTARGQRDALCAAAEPIGAAAARAFMATRNPELAAARGLTAGKVAAPYGSPPLLQAIARAAALGAARAHAASKHASDVEEQVMTAACRRAAAAAEAADMPWGRPPLPLLKGDPVVQVGFTTRRGRDAGLAKLVLVLGTCEPIAGVDVRAFPDEAALLRGTVAAVAELDPDFLTGWNTMGFDFAYLHARADELGLAADMEMGRRAEGEPPLERTRFAPLFLEKRLASAAYGDNTLRFFDMPGRVAFDLMKVVQREHNLSSYKLDDVAKHFTGDCKAGLSPADIFRLHRGSAADRRTVAEYCVQDCALVSDLVVKLNTVANALGMANVCVVPVAWIFLRGQGCKILSLVAVQCRADGFAMPELRDPRAPGYDGAHVLPPRVGVYIDTPVAVLDFSSLYPSSMIATNLSHDTMLLDGDPDPPGCAVEAVTFALYPRDGEAKTVTRRFVQPGGAGREGVLPRILKALLSQRKAVRARMPGEPDPFARAVLDGLQLAFKVTANSLYGQLGSATSDICCVDIAAATTAVGRAMLLKLRDFVQSERGGEVVYGDSVAGYTPVFVRVRGDVLIVTVEALAGLVGGAFRPCADAGRAGKDALELDGVEVWSDAGWTRAHRLVRHRLSSHKRVLRVATRTGVVDVTDDHSMLRPDGTPVKPVELEVGDRLLHADLPPGADGAPCVGTGDQLAMAANYALIAAMNGKPPTVDAIGDMIMLSGFGHSADPDVVTSITPRPPDAGQLVYDFTTDNGHFSAGVGRVVVHNTDSCFMTFPAACAGLVGPPAVGATIAAAQACSHEFRARLPPPQDAEYEKTFWPLILISKKRYAGNMYEADADAAPKQKSMGLVLKRRDNAPIVKHVYGGVIDRILNGGDIAGAAAFVKERMAALVAGAVPVDALVVSKSLRTGYANPEQVAHAVLARRMAERDPGSAPANGDRVPFVYVRPAKGDWPPGTLQGARIEHPDHLPADLRIDYMHYVTNQVMKPVAQLFALVVQRLPGCRLSEDELEAAATAATHAADGDAERGRRKVEALKQAEVERLLFRECIDTAARERSGMRDITSYCVPMEH